MRRIGRLVTGGIVVVLAAVACVVIWLTVAPPALLRVGSGYAAKIVCSNVFLAGRDAQEVLAVDVQAPGHPLLRLMRVSVDREAQTATAALVGHFAENRAVYREGLGCSVMPDGIASGSLDIALPLEEETGGDLAGISGGTSEWPVGDAVAASRDSELQAILSDPALTGAGMRAIVVVKDGRIVGEAYGEGFSAETPLLGWSMAKTVNAAIIGRLVMDGRIALQQANLFPQWQDDGRKDIRLEHLLAMESGLAFNESYGEVTDVTRMLYLESDMAGFAAATPQEAAPGEVFNYSSGASVLLSRIWMNRFADRRQALAYPRQALFSPLGMRSAVMETDASGTFIGSSYLYATGRDWARFALFLLQDGVWNGERLLPEGFVGQMGTASVASGGRYTRMQAWRSLRGERQGSEAVIPEDTFWMRGHDGQAIAIVPSHDLAVIRLGLTPSRSGYDPQALLRAVIDAVK